MSGTARPNPQDPVSEEGMRPAEPGNLVEVNRLFHDHECHYYDRRFAIVHDARSARRARAEVEGLLGRPLTGQDLVLDVGCGTGWFAAGLRRASPEGVVRVVGADLSAGMLSRAKDAGAWPLLQADAARLPLRSGGFDVVVCRGVLHHLPDVPAALREWRRVLRPGGAVVIAGEPTPTVDRHGRVLVRGLLPMLHRGLSAQEDFWEVASMAANLHVFTAGQLAETAAGAGFGQVRLRTADLVARQIGKRGDGVEHDAFLRAMAHLAHDDLCHVLRLEG